MTEDADALKTRERRGVHLYGWKEKGPERKRSSTCVPELGHKIYVLRVDHVYKSLKAPWIKDWGPFSRKETDISVSIFPNQITNPCLLLCRGILVTYYRVRIPSVVWNILTSLGVLNLHIHGYLNALSCPQWTTANSPVSEPPLILERPCSLRAWTPALETDLELIIPACVCHGHVPQFLSLRLRGRFARASQGCSFITLRRESESHFPQWDMNKKPGVQMLVVTILQPDDEVGTGPCCHGRGPGFTNAWAGG